MPNSLSLLLHNSFSTFFPKKVKVEKKEAMESFDHLILDLALSDDIDHTLRTALKDIQSYIREKLDADVFVLSPKTQNNQWLFAKSVASTPSILSKINKQHPKVIFQHRHASPKDTSTLSSHVSVIQYGKNTPSTKESTLLTLVFASQKPSDERIQFYLEKVIYILEKGLSAWHKQQTKIQSVVDEINANYAAELHDTLAQTLGYLRIKTCSLAKECQEFEGSSVSDTSAEIASQVKLAYRQARDIITTSRTKLEPEKLIKLISNAIEDFELRSSIVFEFDNRLKGDLHTPDDGQVLYIVREALSNTIRHAQASHARVLIQHQDDGRILIRVEDNGKGIQENGKRHDSFGLRIMHERAEKISASLTINKRQGGGTRIDLSLPEVNE